MTRLFAPAVALMQRLRLLPKFILVSLLFALPLLAISTALMGQLQGAIDSAERERAGLATLARIHEISLLAQELRGRERQRLSTNAGHAPADIARLRALVAALPADASPQLDAVRAGAEALGAAAGLRDSYTRYSALIGALRRLAELEARRSGLDHDPEAAGGMLAALIAHELPALAERLGDIGARGAAYIDTGLFDGDDERHIQSAMMAAAEQLQRGPERLAALREAGHAAPLDAAAFAPGLAFLERTRDEVGNSAGQTSGAAYFGAAMRAAATLHRLSAGASAQLSAMLDARIAAARLQRNLTLAAIGASCALAGWLFAGLVLAFTRDLGQLNAALQRAAAGDLSAPPASCARDEIGELVNAFARMCAAQVALVAEIRRGAASIGTAGADLAEGNAVLARHSQAQVQALARTVASVDTLAHTFARSAGHAEAGRAVVERASSIAGRGAQALDEVHASMAAIRAGSRTIGEIVNVINEIAFQTNILALNAAVEAAHAGELGRGFAVVASEVRGLAQRSAGAALQIRELIGTAVASVDGGAALVESAGATIGQLVHAVREVEGVIGAIGAAGTVQHAEIARLEDALAEIGAMAQENGRLTGLATAQSTRLGDESRHLERAVRVFKTQKLPKTQF